MLVGDFLIPTMIIILSWVATAFIAFNTVSNLASTITGEKILFTPITFLLTQSCLLISISKLEL